MRRLKKKRTRQRIEVEKESTRQRVEAEKKLEAAEKENARQRVEAEKKLENTIKAVTVGVAAGTSTGSITSISFGRIDKYQKPPLPPEFLIVTSILCSITLGLVVGSISWWLVKNHLNKNTNSK